MMVTQKYNDMIVAATKALNNLDSMIADKTDSKTWVRPVPILKSDHEAYLVLRSMSVEYKEKYEYLYVLNMSNEKFDETMQSLFNIFGRT